MFASPFGLRLLLAVCPGRLWSILVVEGYKFVDSETAEMILVDLWGNPPSAPTERSLGMLFPEEGGPKGDGPQVAGRH